MITQSLINSHLSVIIQRLTDFNICNPALFREELQKANIPVPSDIEIMDENEVYLQEQEIARQTANAYKNWLKAGFPSDLGFTMGIEEADRIAMNQMMVGLKNKAPLNDSEWTIWDINGTPVSVTYSEFKDMSDKYFDYIYNAKEAANFPK